jgi:hypothetical protein
MKIWRVFGMLGLLGLTTMAMAQEDFADRFFAKVEKDALRDLERGKPAKQIEAARTLGAKHAQRVAPVLARHLGDSDPAIRLAAADLLWTIAASEPEGLAAAQPALRIAIDDPDPAVAMNAAGALTAMKVPDIETAAARRRVLQQGRAAGYVQFLAARGLIGIDPGPPLAPIILGYLFDAAGAEAQGGDDNNREIAVQALNALVATQDRGLIAPLQAELGTAHPATEYLLTALHKFEPRPPGWTQTLLDHTRSHNEDVVDEAWDLLAQQRDPASIKLWAPLAVQRLGNAGTRGDALSALSVISGKTTIGLDALVDLAADKSVSEEHSERALDILGDAAEITGTDVDKAVAAAARVAWKRACDPVLGGESAGERFDACIDHLAYIYQDDVQETALLAVWLGSNRDVEAKLKLLQNIESQWSKGGGATEAVKRELAHADPRVVKAAESALDRIRPAWRESAARQSRAASPPAASSTPAVESTGGGRGADGAQLYQAISVGNLAKVKQLVNAGNVHRPVHYPQMQGGTPVPIGIAINYCGIPQLPVPKLVAIVDYLISLGANPDANDAQGENLLDRAKYACAPEVMQALSR